LQDKVVKIECGEFDKYGRLLVTVFHEGVNVNLDLISKGYAKAYNGGSKEAFEE
jgi:endonuclease YncB( thermonuclease family)